VLCCVCFFSTTNLAGAIQRFDNVHTCTLTRTVKSCNACVTLIDKRPLWRFFYEQGIDVATVPASKYNPTSVASFTTKCTQQYEKGAATSDPSAIKTIWGYPDTTDATKWQICAAKANDGTLYEFFTDKAGSRGVIWAALPGVVINELNTPTTVYNFNKDQTFSCSVASCNQATELVFAIDEQQVIPNTDAEFGTYISFAKSVVAGFTERGDTFYGAMWTNNGNPAASPATFQNSQVGVLFWVVRCCFLTCWQASFFNALDGKRISKVGGVTNWPATVYKALQYFWGTSTSTTPRKMIVIVGGGSNGNLDFAAYQALRAQLGVEVFVYAMGYGTLDTNMLNQIASKPSYVTILPATSLLPLQSVLATSSTCPASTQLCSNCNGWCCCANTCCCPTCSGSGDVCNPRVCNVNSPQFGCAGTPFYCNDNDGCTDDTCVASGVPLTASCSFIPKPATYCDDHDACTADSCVSATGGCAHQGINCVPTTTYQGVAGAIPATITVASTTGFQNPAGAISLVTSAGSQTVTCTGATTATTFAGCTGGTGTVSVGASVASANVCRIYGCDKVCDAMFVRLFAFRRSVFNYLQ
jgi:hypothetical protein